MAQPRATSLFHFTRTAENLYGILRNCFYPRVVLEDASWMGAGPEGEKDDDAFGFGMVCFCDIPLSRIQDHVDFYGGYGIGLTRAWATKNGLNPVFYISRSSPLGGAILHALHAVGKADSDAEVRAKAEKTKHDSSTWFGAVHLLAHMKPLTGTVVVAGRPVEKEFYLESEWRYVPAIKDNESVMSTEDFRNDKLLDARNARLVKEACLQFTPQDVRYIFVPTDGDIPRLVSFMNDNLAHHSVADMRILTTRIMSLDAIRDM